MDDFAIRIDGQRHVFRFGPDFVYGNDRMCWTPSGIEKLLRTGLWRREFDNRGNLKSKPITVANAIRLAQKQAA